MAYSQSENGVGASIGTFEENSPPYKKSESYEFHNEPNAMAGGPVGCDSPFKAGDEICQLFLRSKEIKSLSNSC
jgi:hypothetical protein